MAESINEHSQTVEIAFAESFLTSPNERELKTTSTPPASYPCAASESQKPSYSGIEEQSTPFHSFMEHAMTLLFPFLLVAILYSSHVRLIELDLSWMLLIALPIAWAMGDLVSGISHWAADTYGSEQMPVIGASILRPFRLHHFYPRDICTHNILSARHLHA